MMPSSVKNERSLFARIWVAAVRKMSLKRIQPGRGGRWALKSRMPLPLRARVDHRWSMRPISLHNLIRAACVLACATFAPALLPAQQQVDVLIRGGSVIDGTGAAARTADVGIRGDRITFV